MSSQHILKQYTHVHRELREKHESTLGELYHLYSRKRAHGSAFPSIDLQDVGSDDGFGSFEEWKHNNGLDIEYVITVTLGEAKRLTWFRSSNAESIELPSLPPPSPPPGVTIFPDEVPAEPKVVEEPKEDPAPTPAVVDRPASKPSTPATPRPPAYSPTVPTFQPVAGPSRINRSPTPPMTASMYEIQPRSRRVFSPSLPPVFPDWVPASNYAVAEKAPSTPPHILMPLESDYAANLPQLPPVDAHRRRRKDSKGDKGPANLYKLQATYEINPVSSALSKSSKCVLTSDWRVATAELRHIRAMERIEEKKENGRWSLRQPKKLKTMPVRKAHWDYLLDEMVSSDLSAWLTC